MYCRIEITPSPGITFARKKPMFIRLIIVFVLSCLIDQSFGQSGKTYGIVSPLTGELEQYRLQINQVRRSVQTKPDNWEARYTEGTLYNSMFLRFIQLAQIDFSFYNRHRQQMDSLRYQMILNGAEWLDLAATITDSTDRVRQQQKALFQMASGYHLANDFEYETRICEKLDTLGYKFPNWVHGPYFGAAIGTLPTVEVGYHLGYRRFKNRLLGQLGGYSGAQLGLIASPSRGVLGVSLGYSSSWAQYLMWGIHAGFVGNSERRPDAPVDPQNNDRTVIDAYIIRPEIGLARGPLQLVGAFNFTLANSAATEKRSAYAVSAWPVFQVGLRYFFCFKLPAEGAKEYHQAVADHYK